MLRGRYWGGSAGGGDAIWRGPDWRDMDMYCSSPTCQYPYFLTMHIDAPDQFAHQRFVWFLRSKNRFKASILILAKYSKKKKNNFDIVLVRVSLHREPERRRNGHDTFSVSKSAIVRLDCWNLSEFFFFSRCPMYTSWQSYTLKIGSADIVPNKQHIFVMVCAVVDKVSIWWSLTWAGNPKALVPSKFAPPADLHLWGYGFLTAFNAFC